MTEDTEAQEAELSEEAFAEALGAWLAGTDEAGPAPVRECFCDYMLHYVCSAHRSYEEDLRSWSGVRVVRRDDSRED